ncbi:MAG: flagellar hook-basal body complex protein FliE [Woeseia sp.]|nr:flagellar hook-basal body complex protein FliE [Woeseia sp.]MBT8097943.1 flagellar hook-basal body complex protein FliE [Woeseia sp.]NNE60037.1 flagellar hook-basal body complex protein FliE [Woeseia sp.]NNL54059.1 flagellar hook-basal body complex protein FliE [Woeseia sp.]
MSEISPQQLLSQIRAMQTDLHGAGTVKPTAGDGFGEMLKSVINNVNETQQTAASMKEAFATGEGSASLAEVMIASQKADLSFRAMTEVRNKLVNAYQEIMNMPV